MLDILNQLDLANNTDMISPLLSVYPRAYFSVTKKLMKKKLEVEMKKGDLEILLGKGVSEGIIGDQLLVANRVNSVLKGVRSWIEDKYFTLGRGMSGNSRHSLVLMCSYGNGNPLNELNLGRYEGNDFLKGNQVDLMGDESDARRTLREIRSREGIGALVINGAYSLRHSGVRLPITNTGNNDYNDNVERGSRTEAMLEFSKRHPTYSDRPVWFYRLNGHESLILNGEEYKLRADN